MTEEKRRNIFIKAAHEVIRVWPGYAAHQFPAPTNRTDQCIQCDLRFSLDRLVTAWRDVRSGQATDEDFEDALRRWTSDRMYAAEVFNIGKPEGEHAVCKKMKYAVEESRKECRFKKAVETKA